MDDTTLLIVASIGASFIILIIAVFVYLYFDNTRDTVHSAATGKDTIGTIGDTGDEIDKVDEYEIDKPIYDYNEVFQGTDPGNYAFDPNSDSFKSKDIIGNIVGEIVKSVAISEGIEFIIKNAIKKVMEKTVIKILYKLQAYSARIAGQVIGKIGLRKGAEFLMKLGVKAGEKAALAATEEAAIKAAKKISQEVAEKAGKSLGGKIGSRIAAKTAIGASTGPAAPYVTAALYAFEVFSVVTDLLDAFVPGGTVGYAKMGTKKAYKEVRDQLEKELKDSIEESGQTYPIVVGPIDKLTADDYKTIIDENISNMMNDSTNPAIKPMIDAIISDIQSGQLLEADLDNDDVMDKYSDFVDADKLAEYAFRKTCEDLDGKVIRDKNGNIVCSYKDADACNNSYSWPLKENSLETYAKYEKDVYGGSCVVASFGLRGICETNKLGYDTETGLCIIDENYCKTKGADWLYDDDLGEYDCKLNAGQDFAELLFGTTIVRGLKQVFDPEQYEKCQPGEYSNAYACSSCNAGDEVNGDLNTLAAVFSTATGGAALATTGALNMCYPKCKEGFHPFGCCVCSPNCPEGWTDDGATCRLAGKCEPGFDRDGGGALCYPNCKEGYFGNGPVCWEKCPEDYHDSGAFCTTGSYAKKSRFASKTPCPEGMRDDGTSCWLDTYGNGVGYIPILNACPDGSRDIGGTCWGPSHTSWGSVGCTGGRPFRVEGYGDCYTIDKVWKNIGDRGSRCNGDDQNIAGLCYKKCKPGYHYVGGNLCEPDGGPGIKKTVFEREFCNQDEYLVGGVCWTKCKDGYRDDGAFCSREIKSIVKKSYGRGLGVPDTKIISKPNTSYGRGGGYKATVRLKKRAVDFSSVNN